MKNFYNTTTKNKNLITEWAKGLKYTFLRGKKYTIGQQAHVKMLGNIDYQRNAS
jgi:hypothetical protein